MKEISSPWVFVHLNLVANFFLPHRTLRFLSTLRPTVRHMSWQLHPDPDPFCGEGLSYETSKFGGLEARNKKRYGI